MSAAHIYTLAGFSFMLFGMAAAIYAMRAAADTLRHATACLRTLNDFVSIANGLQHCPSKTEGKVA